MVRNALFADIHAMDLIEARIASEPATGQASNNDGPAVSHPVEGCCSDHLRIDREDAAEARLVAEPRVA